MGSHKMKGATHGLFGGEARNAKKAVNIASHSVLSNRTECEAILSPLKPTVSA